MTDTLTPQTEAALRTRHRHLLNEKAETLADASGRAYAHHGRGFWSCLDGDFRYVPERELDALDDEAARVIRRLVASYDPWREFVVVVDDHDRSWPYVERYALHDPNEPPRERHRRWLAQHTGPIVQLVHEGLAEHGRGLVLVGEGTGAETKVCYLPAASLDEVAGDSGELSEPRAMVAAYDPEREVVAMFVEGDDTFVYTVGWRDSADGSRALGHRSVDQGQQRELRGRVDSARDPATQPQRSFSSASINRTPISFIASVSRAISARAA